MSSGTRSDLIGRIIGMLVFLIGVALLLIVFYISYKLFGTPSDQALDLRFTRDPTKDPSVALIVARFAYLLFRIGYLFLMAIAGSLVANKGINLYFSALQGSPIHLLGRHFESVNPPAANTP